MVSSSVVFPAPLPPTTATSSPGWMASEMRWRSSWSPVLRLRSTTSIRAPRSVSSIVDMMSPSEKHDRSCTHREYERSCYPVKVPAATKRPAGQRTRAAILHEAVSLATVDGLDGLSIGNLAAALDMSKSGLYAHFGSKQELQLATIEEAGRVFQAEVIEPGLAASPGVPQLVAVCDAFFEHLGRRRFPGGCFFAGAALEMSARPGPVNERIVEFQTSFAGLIRDLVTAAQQLGQLSADEDPDQL